MSSPDAARSEQRERGNQRSSAGAVDKPANPNMAPVEVIELLDDSSDIDDHILSDAELAERLQSKFNAEQLKAEQEDAKLAELLQFEEAAHSMANKHISSIQHESVPLDRCGVTQFELRESQMPETFARTTGIFKTLKKYFSSVSSRTQSDRTARFFVSRFECDHFHQVIDPKQKWKDEGPRTDRYSCGYRSMQMIASSLLHHPRCSKLVFSGCGFVPELEDMKRWLEHAWQQGFDPVGRAQLFPVVGTNKWVGTSECWALLSSFGVSCRIVTFLSRASAPPSFFNSKKRRISTSSTVQDAVRDFLLDYFGATGQKASDTADLPALGSKRRRKMSNPWNRPGSSSSSSSSDPPQPLSASRTCISNRWPLYMQHNGHARVCFGISVRDNDFQLLIFDPATYGPGLMNSLLRGGKGWHSMVKRGLHTLRKPEYQFVVPEPDVMCSKKPRQPVEEVVYV